MIYAYSDGACKGNPGVGAWGVVIKNDLLTEEYSGFEPATTNNRMELTAAIQALAHVKEGSNIVLTTDSKYVIQGITEWIHGWKRKGWTSSAGGEVKNIDLWQQLDKLVSARNVKFEWVKGHAGHPENERCDELANIEITKNISILSKVPGDTDMEFGV